MIEIDKKELKRNLETRINRVASVDECCNAEKDPLLLLQQVFKRISDLNDRLSSLEAETKIKKNGII